MPGLCSHLHLRVTKASVGCYTPEDLKYETLASVAEWWCDTTVACQIWIAPVLQIWTMQPAHDKYRPQNGRLHVCLPLWQCTTVAWCILSAVMRRSGTIIRSICLNGYQALLDYVSSNFASVSRSSVCSLLGSTKGCGNLRPVSIHSLMREHPETARPIVSRTPRSGSV
jgi:hypothetical protein